MKMTYIVMVNQNAILIKDDDSFPWRWLADIILTFAKAAVNQPVNQSMTMWLNAPIERVDFLHSCGGQKCKIKRAR